jgi:hypothetical protein
MKNSLLIRKLCHLYFAADRENVVTNKALVSWGQWPFFWWASFQWNAIKLSARVILHCVDRQRASRLILMESGRQINYCPLICV